MDEIFARDTDIENISAIWRMAFSDSDEYINLFLANLYSPENTIVSRECGVVVSMAFLIPAQLVVGGRPYSAYYFYAAATHPKYRRRGHMEKVINSAKAVAKERGIDFIVLVPAEEYLFDYYSKFGFETKFNKKVVHYTRSELKALATEPDLSEAFKLNVFETRQTSFGFKDFFNWGEAALKYAMMEHTYCSGSIAFTSDGYAMYNMGKDTVYVKEMCTLSDPSELFKMLLLEDGAEKFTFNLPSFSSICKEDETVENVGMSVPTSEEGKKAQEVLNNAWIGLTLG